MKDVTQRNIIRSVNLIDAVGIAGATIMTRQLLGQFIGVNSWRSAIIKIGGAVTLDYTKFGGKIGDYVKAGLLIDGATDTANLLLNMVGVKAKNGVKSPNVL